MGSPVNEKYNEMIFEYFQKKELAKKRAQLENEIIATSALQKVKQNQMNYEKIKNQSKQFEINNNAQGLVPVYITNKYYPYSQKVPYVKI